MKQHKYVLAIALIALCLTALVGASAAANPLSNPNGLALDAKGNLYVANTHGNGTGNVIVFNPSYNLQTALTITQGIKTPAALAFDPSGNLWVANAGALAQYANGIPTGQSFGYACTSFAIDGNDDLYCTNGTNGGYFNVTVFSSTLAYTPIEPVNFLDLTIATPIYGVALSGNVLAIGGPNGTSLNSLYTALQQNALAGTTYPTMTGAAIGGAGGGVFYVGNLDGTLDYVFYNGGVAFFATLGFTPTGIAVDNARGRIYVANGAGNSIAVYNTAGTLIHTIK